MSPKQNDLKEFMDLCSEINRQSSKISRSIALNTYFHPTDYQANISQAYRLIVDVNQLIGMKEQLVKALRKVDHFNERV